MREKRPTLAACALAGLVLAQLAGCGGCVKDDPPPPGSTPGTARKPIDLRAADKRLSQFSNQDGAADAASD